MRRIAKTSLFDRATGDFLVQLGVYKKTDFSLVTVETGKSPINGYYNVSTLYIVKQWLLSLLPNKSRRVQEV